MEADVNFMVVKKFVRDVSEKAVGKEVLESLTPGQQVIKIVNDQMIELLGSKVSDIKIASQPPTVILMAGLQGAGKTTMCGKLCKYFRKKGKKPPMSKKKKIIIIASAVAAALLLFVVIGFATGLFGGKEIEAPDFKNMTLKEAKIAAKEYKIRIKKGDEVVSEEVEKGRIVSQDPDAGTTIKTGSTVTVNISKGLGDGSVPDLRGKKQSELADYLEAAGF